MTSSAAVGARPTDDFRFDVALSFAGDNKRPQVRRVAEILREKLGPGKVFFDEWFEAEIAGQDASTVLQNIYRRQTRLVVTCVCQRYAEKPWTQDEWRAIQSFERTLRDAGDANVRRMRFLPLRFGDGELDGLFDTAIVPDVRDRSPKEIADLILERLSLSQRDAPRGGATSPRLEEKHPQRASWPRFAWIAFGLAFVAAAALIGLSPRLRQLRLQRRSDAPVVRGIGPSGEPMKQGSVTTDKVAEPALKIAGLIEDRRGRKVSGAQVTLPMLQLRGESNRDGYFEMKVSSDGPTDALLRVEKEGFRTLEQYVSVGDSALILTLERSGTQAVGPLKE